MAACAEEAHTRNSPARVRRKFDTTASRAESIIDPELRAHTRAFASLDNLP